MSGVITAIAVVGAGTAIASGEQQRKSASKAAAASRKGTAYATEQVESRYSDVYNQLTPYADIGESQLKRVRSMDIADYLDGQTATGDMQKYIDQLEALDFQFDENDPIYQWKLAENQRVVNQFQASRGNYDSRVALNALMQGQMAVTEDEIDRQFNQTYLAKYNKLLDLANLSYTKASAEYTAKTNEFKSDYAKNMALLNLGYGAATDISTAKMNEASTLAGLTMKNTENQQNALLQIGTANAGMAEGIGESITNALVMA